MRNKGNSMEGENYNVKFSFLLNYSEFPKRHMIFTVRQDATWRDRIAEASKVASKEYMENNWESLEAKIKDNSIWARVIECPGLSFEKAQAIYK